MGIQIIAKGADFSGLGLGNVNLSETYIATTGITNAVHKAAIRTFYNSFKAAGFYKKFGVARLFYSGVSLVDSINLINPVPGIIAHQATYVNDALGRHTSDGWSADGTTTSYGNGNFALGQDLKNFHMHAWNTTQETQGGSVNKYLLGVQGGGFFIGLQRNGAGKIRGAVSLSSSVTFVQGSAGSESGTGLISVSRQGNTKKLYSAGALASTITIADNPTSTAASTIKEGTLDTASAGNYSTAFMRFLGYGFSDWSDSDEASLKAMIEAFNTAIA